MAIYADRRGLSNRPARGTLISCGGSGDCCGQVQGEACGGLVSEGRMGPRGVVVDHPSSNETAGMIAEDCEVAQFAPMAMAGRRLWIGGGGTPTERLSVWCDAVAQGSEEARQVIMRLSRWSTQALRATA